MTTPFSPPLENAGWEAFAQARARGLSSRDAAAAAGYARPGDEASRLRKRPQIQARIGAIVERRGRGGSSDVSALIDKLVDLADRLSSETAEPRALDVARGCLAEAGRLKQFIPPEPMPAPPPKPAMSLAQWRMKYDPTLPGSEAARRAAGEDLR